MISVEESGLGVNCDTEVVLDEITDQLSINLVVVGHFLCQMNNVVISDMLLGSSSHSIMMLVNTHPVEHAALGLKHLFHFLLGGALLDGLDGVKVVGGVEVGLAISDLLLSSLS